MRYVVLGLLIVAPRTIYQLNKQFQVLLFYQASLGSIRTALQALVRDGNATVTETIENGRLKKIYSPTERGIATFQEWMHSPISGSNLDTAMLSRLYFLGLIDAPSDRHTLHPPHHDAHTRPERARRPRITGPRTPGTPPRAPLPEGHSGLRHRHYGILREVSSGPHHIGSALS